MSITKKKIKSTSVNEQTGEIHQTITTQTDFVYRRPIHGYKGTYMKRLSEIVHLSKTAQRLFFALTENVNEYNRVVAKWNGLIPDNASNISKAKKELLEQDFIAKIGKAYVLNPFVVLPRYQTQSPQTQTEVQLIYNRYVHDLNDWYEGIDEDASELYDVKLSDNL